MRSSDFERLVIARVGWMRFYRGVRDDDPAPKGGGSYNRKKTGHENSNFLDLNGVVRGYARGNGLNLRRIDPNAKGSSLEHVTVVFVAPDVRKIPRGPRRGQMRGGQKVIGWYRDATVFAVRQWEKEPARKKHADHFLFQTNTANAVLLPEADRLHIIPYEKGALGTSNITYALDNRGDEKPGKWVKDLRVYLKGAEHGLRRQQQDVDDDEAELRATADVDELEDRVLRLLQREVLVRPIGEVEPARVETASSRFERRPDVVAWVLRECCGKCEVCSGPAPFSVDGSRPFLEMHHMKMLADGGPDVVENVVAACPNCHRALHFAHDRDARNDAVYARVKRLRRH